MRGFRWLFLRRFLAARTEARIDIWYLLHDLLQGGLGLRDALGVVMQAKSRETIRVRMLRDWQAALASGGDDFAVELSRWVPASEAMVFYGLGRARAEVLFLAAARVAEMRSKQVRAVANAMFLPLVIFVGCVGMTWWMDGTFDAGVPRSVSACADRAMAKSPAAAGMDARRWGRNAMGCQLRGGPGSARRPLAVEALVRRAHIALTEGRG